MIGEMTRAGNRSPRGSGASLDAPRYPSAPQGALRYRDVAAPARHPGVTAVKKNLLLALATALVLARSPAAPAAESDFSAHLFPKFQAKACTNCHDFFEQQRDGLAYTGHKGRSSEMCTACHNKEVSGFEAAEDWFAQPGLYTSGMTAVQTCEAVKAALHAKFKSKALVVKQIRKHLLEDPRVLWGIEEATPKSGALPSGKRQTDLVKGGMAQWKEQIEDWIARDLKCQ
jgi:hypothetical protein